MPADEPEPIEIDARPTVAGRVARWSARARVMRESVEVLRSSHESVDTAFEVVERDSTIGGGILGGALAHRLFVFLLPLALLLVSGMGIYADATHQGTADVVSESGLTGLIAQEISATASGKHRALVFVLSVPALLYTLASLYRAIAVVHAIAWHGSGRGVRADLKGTVTLGLGLLGLLVGLRVESLVVDRWLPLGALVGLATYVAIAGAAWLFVSHFLPRGDVGWHALVPGAVLFGVGMLCVNAFNVFVTSRLVEGRSDTYGALGVAAALLLSLYLSGRVIVLAAVLDATRARRHSVVT